MSCDRYEHLLNEGTRAAAADPSPLMEDIHSMIAISGRAVEAHLLHCDTCHADGRTAEVASTH